MTAFFVQLQAGTKEGGVQNISYGAEMRNDVVSGHNDIPWRTLLALQGTYGILGRSIGLPAAHERSFRSKRPRL